MGKPKSRGNITARSHEEYLQKIAPSMEPTMRTVLALLRRNLPDWRESVNWGIATFDWAGKPLAGIAARKGFYSLYVPEADLVAKYAPKLGKVTSRVGCIRFTDWAGVNALELKRLIAALRLRAERGGAPTAPAPKARATRRTAGRKSTPSR